MESAYPPSLVLHVPHDSTFIPPELRDQFLLDDEELNQEMVRLTDHRVTALFGGHEPGVTVVAAPVSRLVVDMERFEQDAQESMAAVGMGVIYSHASDGRPLRRPLQAHEREALLSTWYRPHHRRLLQAVEGCLHLHGHCLILDAHSFPGSPLAYEADQSSDRPDICIGTDPFHTPRKLEEAFARAFSEAGFTVAVNRPFSGALVPGEHYHLDRRVMSVMVEVNRRLYLDEVTALPLASFVEVAGRIHDVLAQLLPFSF